MLGSPATCWQVADNMHRALESIGPELRVQPDAKVLIEASNSPSVNCLKFWRSTE